MPGLGIGLGVAEILRNQNAFTPSSITGLQLWLDAADSSTLYQSSGGTLALSNGDPIGQWQDKSGNGNHATQSDGLLKPQVQTNSQASKPGVNFPDATDYMGFSRIQGIKHIFFVAKRDAATYPDQGIIIRDAVGGSDKDGLFFASNLSGSKSCWLQGGTDGGITVGYSTWVNLANNTAHMVEAWANGTNRNLRTNATTSISGANIYDIKASQIGSYHISAYNLAGIIYELCIFTSQLSASNIASMQAYLRGKWGTP